MAHYLLHIFRVSGVGSCGTYTKGLQKLYDLRTGKSYLTELIATGDTLIPVKKGLWRMPLPG